YDPATQTFGPEHQLVSDGNNNYYPSFSPDGQWILFNRAASGDAYNNGNASLWVIKADGSAPAVELASSNAALGLTNSWGRWAPFAQTIGTNGEQMYWVTVSSTRNFGVRLVGAARPQIWMTPFFSDRATMGQDPSDASFRLPFQNIESNNHIAQWTEQVVATQ
ncbi:MAG: tolB protein precursor, partial [Myxococcales bacterium]|nr:tolB protein precursor [Myxococcales bacterium]